MAHLSVLVAKFGKYVPYARDLGRGFPFRTRRVPFLNRQKGIYRSAVQRGHRTVEQMRLANPRTHSAESAEAL
jgi:hypothetical protein